MKQIKEDIRKILLSNFKTQNSLIDDNGINNFNKLVDELADYLKKSKLQVAKTFFQAAVEARQDGIKGDYVYLNDLFKQLKSIK